MNPYRDYSEQELEAHLSNYMVNNLSFSAVAQFCRNEKCFERKYIYREYGKNSASSVAGNAYHHALRTFFYAFSHGEMFDLADLEKFAFDYIDERPAYQWKLQKTTPDIETCIKESTKIVAALLKNFFEEISIYLDEIEEVLHVEVKCEQFIDVNGVPIPLPIKGELDLVFKSKSGLVVITDHKSKKVLSSEEDMKLKVGKQAIIYTLLYEAEFNTNVDEVWFIENKYSQNKDRNIKQLNRYKVKMDVDTRRLYEALLYEAMKRVIEAVADPDYVYVINDSDTLEDYADLCNFWMRTLIMEAEDFNVDPSKREMIARRLKKTRDASIASINPNVIKNFKQNAAAFIQYDLSNKNMTNSEKIEHALRSFGIISRVAHNFEGCSSNTYLLEVSGGTSVKSIYAKRLDIANQLDVANVRIAPELAVYNGKSYISVDHKVERNGDLFFEKEYVQGSKLPLGKDNLGNVIVWDLDNQSTPHALICGATGSGKSVQIKTIMAAAEIAGWNIVILDPKCEFNAYKSKHRVIQDIEEIEFAMADMVVTMNDLVKSGQQVRTLIVFDEVADAVAASKTGKQLDVYEEQCVGMFANGSPKMAKVHVGTKKSLEENLRIIAQKGRSSGLRLLCGLQRASTKIITGDTKANFGVRICFYVPSAIDSKVVLDEVGAEELAGRGDGLIVSPQYRGTIRFQGFYIP